MSDIKDNVVLTGKKLGMIRLFDETGNVVVCTAIQIDPNTVAQVKTEAKDGYNAVQLAAVELSEKKAKRLKKPNLFHFKKKSLSPHKILKESKINAAESYQVGQKFDVTHFKDVAKVDVTADTKGKGFQGVMKRHGFAGGPAAHGSGFHRSPGSTGMRTTPGRVFKGHPMAGHMGSKQVTIQSLKVVQVDEEKNILFVKGAVPGSRSSVVQIKSAVKHHQSA